MCLEELLVADVFLGGKWGVTTRGGPSFFLITHIDSVTQCIQLVSSLLQSC